MRSSSRLLVSVVSACALAVPLSGCGPAADNASSKGTSSGAGVRAMSASTDAVAAFLDRVRSGMGNSGSAHLQLTATGSMPGHAVGDMSYGASGGPEAQITASAPILGGKDAKVIMVGHAAYVSVPGLTPPGKYVRIDQQAMGMSGAPAHLDPNAMFHAMRAGISRVEDLGTEQVGGVSTEHYRLHLSPAKAAGAMRSLLGPAAGQGGTGPGMGFGGGPMAGQLPKQVVADIWLDGQDHIRQVRADLGGEKVQLELSSWGESVDVQAPPAADVVAVPQGGMSGFGSRMMG